jgi:ATP-dependent Clp protease ATP-binding subunit ClpA
VVVTEEAEKQVLGFEFPEGPVTPRPEKVVEAKPVKRKPRPFTRKSQKPKNPGGGGGSGGGGGIRTVPKVPLVRA